MARYVVGAGPVGRAVLNHLSERSEAATLISRRPHLSSQIVGSIVDPDVRSRIEPGSTIYHCANAPYHRWPQELPSLWRAVIDAAVKQRARLIIATNLYAYGRPSGVGSPPELHEAHAKNPHTVKGRVRLEVERLVEEAVKTRGLSAVLVRGSDFFGPGGCESALGDRFFRPLIQGKDPVFTGSLDAPHSYTYLPDFARTMVAAAGQLAAAGKTAATKQPAADTRGAPRFQEWIVPNGSALTARELSSYLEKTLGRTLKPKSMGATTLRIGGFFIPAAREMVEMLYEFTEPFIADGTRARRELGIEPTDTETASAETVQWYRSNKQ